MVKSRRLGAHVELQKASTGSSLVARGAQGKHVAALQDLLVDLGYKMPRSRRSNGFDGIFGPETEKTIKEFQKSAGLKADGLVGPKTLAALDAIIAKHPDLDLPPPGSHLAERALYASGRKPYWT